MKDYKYEPDEGQLTDEQYAKIKEYEYELDKSTGEVVKKYTHEQMVEKMLQNPEVLREYVRLINNGEFKKVNKMWSYRIIKRNSENEHECYYALNEVFYEKDGTPMAFSDADQVVGSSREEIIEVLEMMLADAKKDLPVLTEDDFKV